MFRKIFNTIQTKIFVCFLIIMLVVVFAVGSIYLRKINQLVYSQAHNDQKQVLNQVTVRLDELVAFSNIYQHQVISYIASNRAISNNTISRHYYMINLIDLMIDTKQAFSQKYRMIITDPEFGILTDLAIHRDGYYNNGFLPTEKIMQNDYAKNLLVNRNANYYIDNKQQEMLSFYRKIKIFSKTVSYNIVQVDIPYEEITKITSGAISGNEEIAIISKDGYIILCSEESLIGKNSREKDIIPYWIQKGYMTEDNLVSNKNSFIITAKMKEEEWKVIKYIPKDLYLGKLWEATREIAVFMLLFILIGFGLAYLIASRITLPIKQVVYAMKDFRKGNFDIRIKEYQDKDMHVLSEGFNKMVVQIDHLMKDAIEKEREKNRIELNALQSQISFHFIYNTLNSIKWMAINSGVMEIANAIVALIYVLKYITKSSNVLVPLEVECDFLKQYAIVQKMRYGEIFEVEYRITEDVRKCQIPKLLLQPIFENSIIHAFPKERANGHIDINAHKTDRGIKIWIRDNGIGFDTNGAKGVGIANVDQRIKLWFGEEYGLVVESGSDGTTAVIELPEVLSEQ